MGVAADIFTVIGCVITSIINFVFVWDRQTFFGILWLALSLILTIATFVSVANGNKKPVVGILNLIFNSFLGGLFYLIWKPAGHSYVYEKPVVKKKEEEEAPLKPGTWRCPECKRINMSYASGCVCGYSRYVVKKQAEPEKTAEAAAKQEPEVKTERLSEEKTVELLKEYAAMKETGILTEEEFDRKKKELLSGPDSAEKKESAGENTEAEMAAAPEKQST